MIKIVNITEWFMTFLAKYYKNILNVFLNGMWTHV